MDQRHDALLVLSFGGPEGPDDVLPFLRNVVRGRNVPDERLAAVAEQYALFDGVSPINQQNRALISAIETEFEASGLDLPIYWGNRNWQPYLEDAVQHMADDGVTSALVFVTSAFGSYSGCRQYREDLLRAGEAVSNAPGLQKLRLFYNHPGFLEPASGRVQAAVDQHRQSNPDSPSPRLVFTAHSIPISMAENCDYESQLREAADLIAAAIDGHATDSHTADGPAWDLVFQSRSGPPQVPWLEPDIGDHLHRLAADGVSDVVVVPLGFISDHMEVIFDLDTQAAAIAEALGTRMTRAATVGTHPRFVSMIRELVEEQIKAAPKLSIGPSGPWPDCCPDRHCLGDGKTGGRPRSAQSA